MTDRLEEIKKEYLGIQPVLIEACDLEWLIETVEGLRKTFHDLDHLLNSIEKSRDIALDLYDNAKQKGWLK